MSETQDRLNKIANFATAKGLQVTFATKHTRHGVLREITISAYDEPEPAREVEKIAGYEFVKVDADKWVAEDPDRPGERFELSRQDYEGDDGSGDPALEDDWGIWSTADHEWAHEPLETGYPDKQMAIESFRRYLGKN